MTEFLTEEGYTAVLGTNCEQTYERYLRVGERLRVTSALDSVVGPKTTAMGVGYFVTSRNTWYVGDEVGGHDAVPGPEVHPEGVDVMTVPPDGQPRLAVLLGRHRGPASCGSRSATPAARSGSRPGRACQSCDAYDRGYEVASGAGTVFSYVVHRHPPVPGKELPIVIALHRPRRGRADGRRGGRRPDDELAIGDRLRVDFTQVDDELTLPVWRTSMRTLEAGQVIPEWSLPMTPTTIVSTAIATRDWQDVHHDRDVAQAAGSKDIFMNILTTNGLVERFVVDWAGHDAELKGIAIRLGAPAHPYDTLTFSGEVTEVADGVATIAVVGRVSLGDHVTGTVKVAVA